MKKLDKEILALVEKYGNNTRQALKEFFIFSGQGSGGIPAIESPQTTTLKLFNSHNISINLPILSIK